MSSFAGFLVFNEARTYSVKIYDPLFTLFDAVDLNIIAFPVIYVALISFIIYNSYRPKTLMFAFNCYALMVWIRMFAMYITPLDVPEGAIDLNDPIVFLVGTGQTVQKDLFFSGHTASLMLLALVTLNAKKISGTDYTLKADNFMKAFFIFCLVLVAASVVLQKAHYTIDVFAALFFAWGAYSLVKKVYKII
jgi:membrane-associated phospholipid phosphatase